MVAVFCLVRSERFELATFRSVDERSIQLSYERIKFVYIKFVPPLLLLDGA